MYFEAFKKLIPQTIQPKSPTGPRQPPSSPSKFEGRERQSFSNYRRSPQRDSDPSNFASSVPEICHKKDSSNSISGRKKKRSFKRERKRRLREYGRQRGRALIEDRDKYDGQITLIQEERLILAAGATKKNSVFLDLDGTILPFQTGNRKHRAPKFRPGLREFINVVKPLANLFLFSAGARVRTRNIFTRYFQADFCGYFDRANLKRGKKCFRDLENEEHRILVLDDNQSAIHPWSTSCHVNIPRWLGNDDDKALLSAAEEILKRIEHK